MKTLWNRVHFLSFLNQLDQAIPRDAHPQHILLLKLGPLANKPPNLIPLLFSREKNAMLFATVLNLTAQVEAMRRLKKSRRDLALQNYLQLLSLLKGGLQTSLDAVL